MLAQLKATCGLRGSSVPLYPHSSTDGAVARKTDGRDFGSFGQTLAEIVDSRLNISRFQDLRQYTRFKISTFPTCTRSDSSLPSRLKFQTFQDCKVCVNIQDSRFQHSPHVHNKIQDRLQASRFNFSRLQGLRQYSRFKISASPNLSRIQDFNFEEV